MATALMGQRSSHAMKAGKPLTWNVTLSVSYAGTLTIGRCSSGVGNSREIYNVSQSGANIYFLNLWPSKIWAL